jgi:hypothetical protein
MEAQNFSLPSAKRACLQRPAKFRGHDAESLAEAAGEVTGFQEPAPGGYFTHA